MNKRFLPSSAAIVVVAFLGLVVAAGPASALDKAEAQCASSKIKAAGKKGLGKLKCEAKAVVTSTNVDAECLSKATSKFSTAFEKAELKGGCVSTGDTAEVETEVNLLVGRIVDLETAGDPFPDCNQEMTPCGTCGDGFCVPDGAVLACVSQGSINDGLGCTSDTECTTGEYCLSVTNTDSLCGAPCGEPTPVGPMDKAERTCASAKLKAAGKKLLGRLKCHGKAILQNTNVDSECLTKVEGKFSTAFNKAELKGGCMFDGDAPQVEATIDDVVDNLVTLETTVVIVEPLPACTTLGAPCGSCDTGGYCIDHVPAPGCISADITVLFACTTDAECVPGTYCMHAFEWPVIFPLPIPDLPEWICMSPCP
jgi:hypothetical protein